MVAMIDAVLVCSSYSSKAAVKIAKSTPSIRRYVTVSLEGFLSGQITELGQRAVVAFIDSRMAESIEKEFGRALNDIILSDAIPVAIVQLEGSELSSMLYESEHSVSVYCKDFEKESDSISEELNKLLNNWVPRRGTKNDASRYSDLFQATLWVAIAFIPLLALTALHDPIEDALETRFSHDFAWKVHLFLVLIALFLVSFVYLKTGLDFALKQGERRLSEEEDYSRRLRRIITTKDSGEPGDAGLSETGHRQVDVIEHMLVNLEDIKQYYTWSHKQAQSSFWLAISACVAGFIFLVAATLAALLFNSGWESSAIPAIGGAITELIAATALLVYRHSLSQLNYYHEALHEDERFLSSINLVDKLSSQESRDNAISKIIDSELGMNLEFVRRNKSDNQEK